MLYGSAPGLTATGDQLWHQDSPGVIGDAWGSDNFGWSLAVGDFDGDGYDDLAIGVPEEYVGSSEFGGQGAVNVLYGAAGTGLTATGDQLWHQDSPNVDGSAEEYDYFGWSLAVGDFNIDGRDDLAIGVPLEDIGSIVSAGSVNVLFGSSGVGLTATGDELWRQGGTGSGLTGEGPEEALAAGAKEAAEAPQSSASAEAPAVLALAPASPNPFRAQATLRFTLPTSGPVRLAVYDALGRQVAVVVDEAREAGEHAVAFDAHAMPSGTYLVRLEAAGQVLTQRITRLR